jgi:6-phosphogluconolactonase
VFADPAWKRLFVCFLMLDRVLIYRFDENTGALTPSEQPYVQTSSGAGPRHMAFHPSGRFFYTTNEFDATVSAFSHDAKTGAAAIVQTASFHPAGFEGKKNGSHIMVGPTGRFLYCSNRSHQTITIFAIDPASGELRLVGHRQTLGDRPRDFNFDPSGRFLLVTNQNGHTVVSFHVDPTTGDLRPTGHSIESPSANCVVFGPA